jgi:hypothetical protein
MPASDKKLKVLQQKLHTSLLDQKYNIVKGITVVPHIPDMSMSQVILNFLLTYVYICIYELTV